jgi:Ca2+-binding EF-hand superfamily protein
MKTFLIGGAAAAAILAGGAGVAATVQTTKTAPAAKPARAAKAATRADVQSRVATVFAKLDANHDGFVSKDELNAVETRREQRIEKRAERFDPAKIFAAIDLNKDGKITAAEAEAARSQQSKGNPGKPAQAHAAAFGGLFAKADANKDKVITRAEFDSLGQKIKSRIEHAATAQGSMAERMLATTDTNKDGKISLAEMQQSALGRFDRLDLNRDGKVSAQERQQVRQARKAQQHKG